MSGGSFDYVCFKLDGGGWDIPKAMPELRRMEEWLRSYGKHEAADELLQGILRLETAIRRLDVVGKHLYELTHAAEWWCSADWSEDQFDAVFKEHYLGEASG